MKKTENVKDSQGKAPRGISGSRYYLREMESGYVDTASLVSQENDDVQLHSHSFFEILYCRSCAGVEYLVGSERYRLQPGDIVMIAPGISHKPILPEQMTEPYVRDMVRISAEMAAEMTKRTPDVNLLADRGTRLLRTAGTQWEYLGQIFRRGVHEAEQQGPGWEYAVFGNTVQLMVHLYRAVLDKNSMAPRAEKPELLDRVLAYVEGRLSQKITLADVARHFFVSESTISQTFRNRMGVSFYRCVTQRRLIAAKLLIAEGMLLEFVGQQVGFSDYSTFYRAFKQEYGISPRQYRKLLEEPSERGEFHV